MGPGCFYPGNRRAPPLPPLLDRASMGPGCFYPGNVPDIGTDTGATVASMGPGCFYPGNHWPSRCPCRTRSSFNGAGMFLARKSAVGSSPQRFLTGLQWGRDVSIPEMNLYRL